ncbi:hemerythrin domain-containing protein [Leeia oryzae]|uniref:hemerythrin domain-containing protein n=1 Tax=Leeia oryzae TaxID=356662 RepID=UPI0003A5A285|nr:hemerythrin domain-containing protein [Leeia oryzae]
MAGLTQCLQEDHQHCDAVFEKAEAAVQAGDWTACNDIWPAFKAQLLRHFDAEEQSLFPAFEAATGMTAGPTFVMREEHQIMRTLVEELDDALVEQDEDMFLGNAETLLMYMQQHNLKEEKMLYPSCDRLITDAKDKVAARLAEMLGQ